MKKRPYLLHKSLPLPLLSKHHGPKVARRSDTRPQGLIMVKAEKNLVKCGIDMEVA
jgi:hypothetical protein